MKLGLLALQVVTLLAISLGAGAGYAYYRQLALFPDLQQIDAENEAHKRWMAQTGVTLDELREHYESGGLVIDARPPEEFTDGHLAAPWIMNVHAEAFAAGEGVDRVLPYVGMPIILYCSSLTCESAKVLWHAMQRWGFGEEVRVYHEGYKGMIEAGLPTAMGPDPGIFDDPNLMGFEEFPPEELPDPLTPDSAGGP